MFIIGKGRWSAEMQCGSQYAPFGSLPCFCVRVIGIIVMPLFQL